MTFWPQFNTFTNQQRCACVVWITYKLAVEVFCLKQNPLLSILYHMLFKHGRYTMTSTHDPSGITCGCLSLYQWLNHRHFFVACYTFFMQWPDKVMYFSIVTFKPLTVLLPCSQKIDFSSMFFTQFNSLIIN